MPSDPSQHEPRFEPHLAAPRAEVYDRSEALRPKRRGRWLAILAAFVALGAFAGVAWYATNKGQTNPGATVPVITAENTPVKERPAEPGGMEVPNRNIQVFDRITPDGQPQKVERLLPPAETPMARPAPEAKPPAGPLVPDAPAIASRAAAPAPRPAAAEDRAVAAVPVTPPRMEDSAPKAAAPKAKAAASAAGAWRIQLGAARDEARAKASIAQMQKANGDLLKGLAPDIVRADLGAKGVFWRMRMGPLADQRAAADLCRKLAARKVGCIVVKP